MFRELDREGERLSMQDIEKIRSQFPITKNKVFLNHASQSPLPKPVANAVQNLVDQDSNYGIASSAWEDKSERHFSYGKTLFAELVNAKTEEVALVENTSMGLNIVANLFDYPRGSKIVTTDLEYPSAVYPWLRKRSVKVEYVKNVDGQILPEDMEKAIDDKTIAVVISHVEYANGFRNDLSVLSEIAHEHGAYLIVDAMQSTGVIPLDVRRDNLDFMATGCYKWLLAPAGAAYLYVKDELITQFEPPFAGWASVKDEIFDTADLYNIWQLKFADTASRFEVGYPSLASFVGAKTAIKMLLDFGIKNVEKRVFGLTGYLLDELERLGLNVQTPTKRVEQRSGIVNFRINNPEEVTEKLHKKGIVVSARANGIRVSPHYYNTEQEIDRFMNEIKALVETV